MYLAIVLNSDDRTMLIDKFFSQLDPTLQPNAEVIVHHCTICMGDNSKGKYPFTVGEEVPMTIVAVGHLHGYEVQSDPKFSTFNLPGDDLFGARYLVTALKVILPEGKKIKNKVPHITGQILRQYGAKPFHSNKVKHWHPLKKEIEVTGTVNLCS